MTDSEFMELDDKLYDLINPLLAKGDENYQMNGDTETFNWYCDIRNKIVDKINS
mgnify:FL=1|tara:strand:+ start:333 stop:494 length:162 start_codon:yes stop_codon:yes gene_type:complete